MNATSVVWFKKDLRIHDHQPLAEAAQRGTVIPLFVYEPELLRSPEFDGQHFAHLAQALTELRQSLAALGGRLLVRTGSVVEELELLRAETGFTHLYSHEETGNRITYDRDIAVGRWAKSVGVSWTEFPQTGVVRRLRSRDGWSRIWEQRMAAPLVGPPARVITPPAPADGAPPAAADFGVAPTTKDFQPGGESAAHGTLEDFLAARGLSYAKGLSSPVTAPDACSRLSAHLAFGTLSMRQVVHATNARRVELRAESGPEARRWFGSLKAFEARLHWHCHFMQKLESEPRLEFENLHRACDGLREDSFNEDHFAAWCAGRTGFPMVDACMRSLLATGWLNFRMRAMLVSFAAYDLWLHWRRPAVFLARHFLDFEPGIHFSQFQMQSGTTGINTLRMYSPTKQGQDHDPDGHFIRRWVPELEPVPTEHIHEPWLMPGDLQQRIGCVIGRHYPAPIVDHRTAIAFAKEKLYGLRRTSAARAESAAIVREHGSRKRPGGRKPRAAKPPDDDLFNQMEFA